MYSCCKFTNASIISGSFNTWVSWQKHNYDKSVQDTRITNPKPVLRVSCTIPIHYPKPGLIQIWVPACQFDWAKLFFFVCLFVCLIVKSNTDESAVPGYLNMDNLDE